MDWDFNASAISRPAFGIIGPSTHYIRFGLPLLASLSEDQLRPVLAHELAHLSRNYSGFGTRIGRASTRAQTIRFCHHPYVWGRLRNRMGDYVSTDLLPFSNHHQIVAVSMTRLLLRRKFSEVENSILYQRKPFEAARVREGAQAKKVPKMPSQREMQRQVEAVMKGINPRTGSKI